MSFSFLGCESQSLVVVFFPLQQGSGAVLHMFRVNIEDFIGESMAGYDYS